MLRLQHPRDSVGGNLLSNVEATFSQHYKLDVVLTLSRRCETDVAISTLQQRQYNIHSILWIELTIQPFSNVVILTLWHNVVETLYIDCTTLWSSHNVRTCVCWERTMSLFLLLEKHLQNPSNFFCLRQLYWYDFAKHSELVLLFTDSSQIWRERGGNTSNLLKSVIMGQLLFDYFFEASSF